jgi:autotransporter translocation and assembly factor TamB
LQLAGTIEQPLVTGSLALLDGAADIPSAGLQLRDIVLRADSAARDDGRMGISGGLASGPGQLQLSGWLDIPSASMALDLKGERLQVFDTPDARVLVSPDMAVAWSDQLLRLRGQLFIPEADITPKLAIGPGLLSGDPEAEVEPVPGQLIAPSPDVVIIGDEESPLEVALLEAPFRFDNQLEVILGDKVKVNAMGFISRITGAVTFRNKPQQKDLMPIATGRLDVVDGTFRAFGQDLDIETGQLIFSGVPVTEPELNVRAVRWIDSDPVVSAAGVLIAGPGTEPRVELFSRPQLDPIEVQSYLLTERAPGSTDNVLNIGTYLHPRFYVGYGYNLIEKTSEFSSLYTITPRYGVGVNVGEADNNVNLTFTHER